MSNAREVERLVRRACAEDGPSVDPEAMRALKRAVRADENALRCAHEALVGIVRGGRSSAGKRTRAVTATAELFERSKLFRELTLDTLDEFLRHAVGTDDDVALPDVPKGSAERLREHAIDTLDGWVSKFGTRYKQLALARAFVTTRLGDEAPEARAERARRAEIEREHAAQRQLQQSWRTMARELPALLNEIDETQTSARTCFHLLFGPRFDTDIEKTNVMSMVGANESVDRQDDDAEEDWEDVKDGAANECRFGRGSRDSVSNDIVLKETAENEPILEQLRGIYRSTKARYVTRVSEILQVLGRIQPGNKDDDGRIVITMHERSENVNTLGELKESMSSFVKRCEALRLIERRPEEDVDVELTLEDAETVQMEDKDIESRQGASNRALDALLERATNRRHRGVKSSAQRAREELAKRKATEDVSRRAQKMLASQIKAHNDEVLAEASLDVFEVERRRQTDASEALVSDLMDEEITRYNELMAKGATPQRRIENRLKHLKRRKR